MLLTTSSPSPSSHYRLASTPVFLAGFLTHLIHTLAHPAHRPHPHLPQPCPRPRPTHACMQAHQHARTSSLCAHAHPNSLTPARMLTGTPAPPPAGCPPAW